MCLLAAHLRGQRGCGFPKLIQAGPGLDPVYHAIAAVSGADIVVVCHHEYVDWGARYFWASGSPPPPHELQARLAPAGSPSCDRVVIVQSLAGASGCSHHARCACVCAPGARVCVLMPPPSQPHFVCSTPLPRPAPQAPPAPLWASAASGCGGSKRRRTPKRMVDAAIGNSRAVSAEVVYAGAGSSPGVLCAEGAVEGLRTEAAALRRALGLGAGAQVSIEAAAASAQGCSGMDLCGRLQVLERILGEPSSFTGGAGLAPPHEGAVDYAAVPLYAAALAAKGGIT